VTTRTRRPIEPVAELDLTSEAVFPVEWAREMIADFPNAHLTVVADAGLFSHEERPADVAQALLPVLTATR
jgi:pimeloyl-ACP methyl ester carboxylesterase